MRDLLPFLSELAALVAAGTALYWLVAYAIAYAGGVM